MVLEVGEKEDLRNSLTPYAYRFTATTEGRNVKRTQQDAKNKTFCVREMIHAKGQMDSIISNFESVQLTDGSDD